MRVLTAEQMREADRRTIDDCGLPAAHLMERAGEAVVEALAMSFPAGPKGPVAIIAGAGHNGGDGLVVARLLAAREVEAVVAVVARRPLVGLPLEQLKRAQSSGVRVVSIGDLAGWREWQSSLLQARVVVDALCGTGLDGALTGLPATVVNDINACGRPVVSIDVPSGVSSDMAEVAGPFVHAALTVALGALKVAHVVSPACEAAGRIVLADIGIPAHVVESLDGGRLHVLTGADVAASLTRRRADSHKGTYGRVLVVAGSLGKTGAAALAALGALRAGAGLVTVATPATSAPVVAGLGLEFMTLPLPENEAGRVSASAADVVLAVEADVIVCGPGLGVDDDVRAFVAALVTRAEVPLVLDADALNALSVDLLAARSVSAPPVVLTPHPGEMGRLVGESTSAVQSHRLGLAHRLAEAARAHVVLKGHRTVIAAPDGAQWINFTGNPGMATAGAGDVLAGLIGGLYGTTRDLSAATRAAVFLHGLAGDLAAAREGEVSMVASDILANLGAAIQRVAGPVPHRWEHDLCL